jgi:hypothetical protein
VKSGSCLDYQMAMLPLPQLHDYRAAKSPPEVPNEFEDVNALLGYHHRRQSSENLLKQHENAQKKVRTEYAGAADELLPFCLMVCPCVTPTKASGASYLARSTLSCASWTKS